MSEKEEDLCGKISEKIKNLKVEISIDIELGPDQFIENVLPRCEKYDQVCFIERYKSGRIRKQTTYLNQDREFKERIILGWYESGHLASSLIYSETNKEYVRWVWDKKRNIVIESYFGGEISDRKLIENIYTKDESGLSIPKKTFIDGKLDK